MAKQSLNKPPRAKKTRKSPKKVKQEPSHIASKSRSIKNDKASDKADILQTTPPEGLIFRDQKLETVKFHISIKKNSFEKKKKPRDTSQEG